MIDQQIEEISSYIDRVGLHDYIALSPDYRLEFLAQGEYNRNYILKDESNSYVFRVNYGSQIQAQNQIEYEYNALQKVSASGVTPKVFFVDGSCKLFERGVLVMEFLEGRPLQYHKDLTEAAKVFASIHALDVSDLAPPELIVETSLFSDRIAEATILLQDVWQSQHISTKLKHFFDKLINTLENTVYQQQYYIDNPVHCINNTEVNSHNFIIGTQASWLVDWEKAVISDPCQDITHFLAVTTTQWKTDVVLSDQQIDDFFRMYLEHIPAFHEYHIEERVKRYQPYLYLRAISWCAYACHEYQASDRAINNDDTWQKIQLFLQPQFLQMLYSNVQGTSKL